MLATRLVAAVVAASSLTFGLTAPVSAKDDTPPPVVVDDAVSLYPGQSRTVDVLANDSSPSGQELALCRFPEPELGGQGELPDVFAFPLGEGRIEVMTFASEPHDATIEYFVCDETHLTRATLHVEIKKVDPVAVERTGKAGQLRVTNANDVKVVFKWGHSVVSRPDGRVVVPAGGRELVQVPFKRIVWIAMIGHGGVAGHGWVKDIKQPR